MNASLTFLFVLQVLLILLLAIVIYTIFNNIKILNYEKRISKYSLTSSKDFNEPFFEDFYSLWWNLIKKLSKLFKKSEVLKKYSKKYDKYISFEDRKRITNMDFISIKFMISVFVGLIYFVSSFFQVEFNFHFLVLIFCLSFFIYDIYLRFQFKKWRNEIEKELLNAIIIMNNAFKSGMNIMQAVDVVKSEISGPIQDEFKKVSIDISYGLSLESVFDRFYNRVKIEDIKYISTSLSLINRTGGNIVKVFNAIERNFYDKKKIKDEMNSLTSSSIFMFRLLVFMPLVLVLIIYILNPNYFEPFFTNIIGRLMLLFILLLFSLYVFVVKKILKVNT